jgi:hypothetical protein
MKKTTLMIALLAALGSTAFAQTPSTSGEKYPPPAAKAGATVPARETARIPSTSGENYPAPAPKAAAAAAKEEAVQYRSERSAARKDFRQKMAALDGDYKAKKIAKADYDAQRKTLRAENKAALSAIAKKYPNAAKAEHSDN